MVNQTKFLLGLMFFTLLSLNSVMSMAVSKNGFDLTGSLIPIEKILGGGPAKDGIPAIDKPDFIKASKAKFLKDKDRVLGVTKHGISKAYPISILNWHEIVNDKFGDDAIIVSFCPLCGTGVAFSNLAINQDWTFGVSGLLYNSDVLLYDRQTNSLWSQLLAQAITGPKKGTKLNVIPLSHTTWGDWKIRHPNTLVLSRDTGFDRNYDRDPYAGYVDKKGILFPVQHRDPRYHPKERVIGIEILGQTKAYAFSELAKTSGKIIDNIGSQKIQVVYNDDHQTGMVLDSDGNELVSTIAFWFAWYAFHPDTKIFNAP